MSRQVQKTHADLLEANRALALYIEVQMSSNWDGGFDMTWTKSSQLESYTLPTTGAGFLQMGMTSNNRPSRISLMINDVASPTLNTRAEWESCAGDLRTMADLTRGSWKAGSMGTTLLLWPNVAAGAPGSVAACTFVPADPHHQWVLSGSRAVTEQLYGTITVYGVPWPPPPPPPPPQTYLENPDMDVGDLDSLDW